MELKVWLTMETVAVVLLSQLLPCRASDRIDNFVVQDSANIRCIGIGRGKRQAPSESLLESELYQWLLDCKIRISKPAKSLQKLTGKTSAKFFIEIDKQDKSARLELTQSSGSKTFDQQAQDVIRKASPFKEPFNDLPYRRGLLIEISPSIVTVKLASNKPG